MFGAWISPEDHLQPFLLLALFSRIMEHKILVPSQAMLAAIKTYEFAMPEE